MSKLFLTLGAAAIGLAAGWPCPRRRRSPRTPGQRDHRLRHRSLPALDRRRGRGLRPQAGKRALPHSRSAPPGRLAASRASPGPRAPSSFETVGRTGINSCSPVGPAGFTGCIEQVINQAFNDREEQVAERKRPQPKSQALAFSAAIQALICASSASSGTAPWPSTASWKRRRSNLSPSSFSALRAQLADLQLADLVGQRLARVGDVAVDLGIDIGGGQRGIVGHEGDRLLLGPALGVDAGVDHQPRRAPHFVARAGPCPWPACRTGPSRSRAAPNRAPSPRRRR